MKKLLTIEDLVKFCQTQKYYNFSAKDTGYQLSVQVPATATFENEEQEDNSLLFCKVQLYHIGRNRNGSSVTKEAAENSLSTIAYRPLLANFCEIDGVKDFTSHDMIINDNGSIEYLERQIGAFTADKPYIEYCEEQDKEFVYAKVAIPREYTDAASIIERKNGTKVSVELLVNSMSYDPVQKVLNLEDIVVQGATCLGVNPETGKPVEEGMEGARLDIADFSAHNNSVHFEQDDKLIQVIQELKQSLDNYTNSKLMEGGDETVTKFEELLKQYNKTVEEITFEYENLSDEELENAFAEAFAEDDTEGEGSESAPASEGGENFEDENNDDNTDDSANEGDNEDNSDDNSDDDSDVDLENDSENTAVQMSKEDLFNQIFELSFEDIRYSLNALCSIYRNDNEWCYVENVYENYFIMCDWDSEKYYKQEYTVNDNNVALFGERIEMFKIMVTESEKIAVENLRANYASIQEQLDKLAAYEKKELDAQKEAIFKKETYSKYLECEEFTSLKENMDNYSVEELAEKAELAFAKCVQKLGFSLTETPVNEKKVNRRVATTTSYSDESKSSYKPYGDLFDEK